MSEERPALLLGDGENKLELQRATDDFNLIASLRTPDLTARHRFEAEPWASFKDLAGLLLGLADDWKGFDGERSWVAGDGSFRIRCRHDRMRSVRIEVGMRRWDEWEIELPISIEVGHLDQMKQEALRFFAFAM